MRRIRVSILVVLLVSLGCSSLAPSTVRGSGKIVSQPFEVHDYSEIELSAIGQVDLVQGEVERVEVEADDNILPYLQVKVENGRLIMADKGNVLLLPSGEIIFRVTAKTIRSLDVSSSGKIRSDKVEGGDLSLTLSGSGELNLQDASAGDCVIDSNGSGSITISKLECNQVELDISGSGSVELSGETKSLRLENSGSGAALLGDLQAADVSAHLSSSGSVTVWAADSLVANVDGSGSLSYYGAPALKRTLSGSGGITPLGAH